MWMRLLSSFRFGLTLSKDRCFSLSVSVPLLAVWQQKTWGGPIDASLNLFVPSPMWGLEYISGSIPEAHLHLSLCLASFFLSLFLSFFLHFSFFSRSHFPS